MELNFNKSMLLKAIGTVGFALVFVLNTMLFVQSDGNNVSAKKSTAEAVEQACKWKATDCPGLGTGDYEACLTNGNGNECKCGSVSRECPKS